MEKVPVSVLLSIYIKERPEYVVACLDSIFNQTVKVDEIVLVEDGPVTEEMTGIIDKYKETHPEVLHVLSLERNVGLGKALAEGVKACRNDLIARMDADDIMKTDRIEKQWQLFQKNPNLVIAGSNIIEFEGNIENVLGYRNLPSSNEYIREFSKRRNPFNHMTVMYKKSDILEVGNYLPMSGFEDYYLWVRLLKNGKEAQNLSEHLVYARTGSDMYARRGGWQYFKSGLKGRKVIYQAGLGSFKDFFVSSSAHVVVSLMPNTLRGKFYEKFLRKEKD
ncbi:glycosyltransferase [Enterococcus faecalis]|uniref:glycosyltransferase n=1 Tax=Enterococcus faecalis TaxID=1351 RepID=UPI0035CC22B1